MAHADIKQAVFDTLADMELKGQFDEKEEVSYEEKGSHDFFPALK